MKKGVGRVSSCLLLVPEAAEPAKGEPPGSAPDAVPADVDAGADMAGADALVVEEAHYCRVCGLFFGSWL